MAEEVPTTPVPSAGRSMTMFTGGGRRVVMQFGEPGVINFIRDDAGNDLLGDNDVIDVIDVSDDEEEPPPVPTKPTKPKMAKAPTRAK